MPLVFDARWMTDFHIQSGLLKFKYLEVNYIIKNEINNINLSFKLNPAGNRTIRIFKILNSES